MVRFSKHKVKTECNGRVYKTKKWSTWETQLEGMRIAKVIAPSITIMGDMWMGKTTEQKELEAIHQEIGDQMYMLTGAITALTEALTDDHFMALTDKLLDGLELIVDGEIVVIEDWSEHFDDFGEDFLEILTWSFKVNILDFFMKQDIVASKIAMVAKVLMPIQTQLESLVEKNTN